MSPNDEPVCRPSAGDPAELGVNAKPKALALPHAWELAVEPHVGVRVGVPNTGRLFRMTTEVLMHAFGADLMTGSLSHNIAPGVEVLCARSTDLPHLAARGIIDLALTASDYVFEAGESLVEVADLRWINAHICLLAPHGREWRRPEISTIATQYPRHATEYVRTAGLLARVVVVSGAAELYPRLGLADAIVDCVETGRTASANHLAVVAELRRISVRLFARPEVRDQSRTWAHIASKIVESSSRLFGSAQGRVFSDNARSC